ncbi:hypothetical protein ABZ760_21400 [Streptomyces sp. NPDC006658]|uniref:hypothetical protein n=1 Tax=Streptomyces sp. NPDC006658 TaxID=3156900 RepID=UPI0033F2D691
MRRRRTVRDELSRHAASYVQADVDARLAHALTAHRGHYADPAVREAAVALLPQRGLTHAALLSALPVWSPAPTSTGWRSPLSRHRRTRSRR